MIAVLLGVGAMVLTGAGRHVEAQERYHSGRYKYAVVVPRGWHRLPAEQLEREVEQGASREMQAFLNFDLVMTRDGPQRMNLPYVVVQVMPYERDIPPTERGMRKFADDIVRAHETRKERGASGEAGQRVGDVELGEVSVSPEDRTFTFEIMPEVAGVGRMHARVYGHFGRHHAIMVMCYALDADHRQHEPTFKAIESSFAFDAGAEYKQPEGLYDKVPGLIVIVVAATIIGLVLRRRRS
jgi:hypothetical protein